MSSEINQIKGNRIQDGTIFNADVADNAAIFISKIDGLQNALDQKLNITDSVKVSLAPVSFFLNDSMIPVPTYSYISLTPSTEAETIDSIAVSNQTLLIEQYISDVLNITSLKEGLFDYNIWRMVSNSGGVSEILFDWYAYHSDGSKTLLYSHTTGEINNLTLTYQNLLITEALGKTILATDRIALLVSAKTTSLGSITVSFTHSGSLRNTSLTTPWSDVVPSVIQEQLDLKEDLVNKVTSVSGSSTDVQYPSAKLLYDQLALKEPVISKNTAFNKNYNTDTANIKNNGIASVGSADLVARADHVHAQDVFTRLAQAYVLQRLGEIVTNKTNIKRVIFFDEIGAVTTLKDRSTYLQNATLSANASTFNPYIEENCRMLNFSTGAYWDFADSDDLSFGNGSTDSAFSIVALIHPFDVVTLGNIVGKYSGVTGNTQKEYSFRFNNNNLGLILYDDSTGGYLNRYYNSSLVGDVGSLHSYISTYSGISSGINIYRDGSVLALTDGDVGAYTAMENKNAYVGNSGLTRSYEGNYAAGFISIIAEELTATQVKDIDILLRSYAGLDCAYL